MKKDVLGVDFGGVILDFLSFPEGHPLSFWGENYLNTPAVKDSIKSLIELNSSKFAGNIFIVSKHGEEGYESILEWLHHQDFFERTGIPESHFYPCRERHEKLPIVKELGVTHFVDDRAEVLGHMIGSVPHLYLFQSLDEKKEDFSEARAQIPFFKTWKELLPELLKPDKNAK